MAPAWSPLGPTASAELVIAGGTGIHPVAGVDTGFGLHERPSGDDPQQPRIVRHLMQRRHRVTLTAASGMPRGDTGEAGDGDPVCCRQPPHIHHPTHGSGGV